MEDAAQRSPETVGDSPSAAFSDAWDAFFRAARRARGRAARSKENEELTPAQFHLLSPLTHAGPHPAGALAEEAGVSAPGATRMLDGLERAGYVERRPHPEDRRVVLISLTVAGGDAVERRRARVAEMRRRIEGSLSARERDQAAVLLRRLAEIVDEEL